MVSCFDLTLRYLLRVCLSIDEATIRNNFLVKMIIIIIVIITVINTTIVTRIIVL